MNKNLINFLGLTAYNLRKLSIISTTQAGSGHPTSALSAADIMSVLFFYAMHYDPNNFFNPDNDRFILSKGHAAPVFYAVYKELGILSEDDLLTLRKFDSVLEGHPSPRFKYTEAATGSLGQGLSIGLGIALSAKIDKREFYTYVLLGDSEVSEGSVWEAVQLASYYKVGNLVAIVDCNRLGQANEVMDDHDLKKFAEKFRAFEWEAIIVDGHNISELIEVFDRVRSTKNRPTVILAKTFKGHGVPSVSNKLGYHGKPFDKKELDKILNELEQQHSGSKNVDYSWQPKLPVQSKEELSCGNIRVVTPSYQKGQNLATRKAYGDALVAVGKACHNIIALDAEVKNSTYSEKFEKEFPERFVESFIAEQNMVGMAVGMASRGKVPFSSTFAAFLTRAFDQIRMASIGRAPLRLVGSHAGVSIGEDGPSQMGLEDIAMMRAVFGSYIFYPSDAVSVYKLVELMCNCDENITYLRTTRMDTPVIYDNKEEFKLGGCKVLRKSESDKICVIGAGITLHQALKAHELLLKKGINISVIDLYCVKPFDEDTIVKTAKNSGDKIIVVEDHYQAGGIGEMIKAQLSQSNIQIRTLFVDKMPRSGTPNDLLSYECINANAIVDTVNSFL